MNRADGPRHPCLSGTPDWVRSQRRARGLCEECGERPCVTEWAGNGWLICWECCEARQAAYWSRP